MTYGAGTIRAMGGPSYVPGGFAAGFTRSRRPGSRRRISMSALARPWRTNPRISDWFIVEAACTEVSKYDNL